MVEWKLFLELSPLNFSFEEDVWNEERTFWLSTSAIWSIISFVVQTLLHETKS